VAKGKWKFDKKKFAMALRLSRGRNGLRFLAKEIGVSNVTIYRLESGEHFPDVPVLIKCCQYMDVELDYFIDHKGDL